jgi:CRISPR-associated protein Cas1
MSAVTDATGETVSTPSRALPPFLAVCILNEFTYCPRLGYLDWVRGEFTANDDTVEDRHRHREVDRQTARPEGDR